MDINSKIIDSMKDKEIFLLDNSFVARLEEVNQIESLLTYISASQRFSYLVSLKVLNEKFRFSGNNFLYLFEQNILHDEYTANTERGVKENRFIIEIDGVLKYIVLNNISTTDYELVTLCQNHPQLTLVSNDRKLLKSARVILGKRVMGSFNFIDYLWESDTDNEILNTVKDLLYSSFEKKKV